MSDKFDKFHPGDSAYVLHTDEEEYQRFIEKRMSDWDMKEAPLMPEFLQVGDLIERLEQRKLSGKISAHKFLILSPVRRYKLTVGDLQDAYIWTVEVYSFTSNKTGVVEMYEAELDDFDIYRDGEKIRSVSR